MTDEQDAFDVDFVDLDRGFYEYSSYAREDDSVNLDYAHFTASDVKWPSLCDEYRIIILSEAGTGKTDEIRNAARKLKRAGKKAFFLRLENIADDFEISFEEGTLEEFNAWIDSNEEGWVLLDSVDEARLQNVRDFERAIKKFGHKISKARDRAHIFITGRTSAWRPKTDLDLCERFFPLTKKNHVEVDDDSDTPTKDSSVTTEKRDNSENVSFKILALDDLNLEQVRIFAENKDVTDVEEFIDAIDRSDARAFSARPQDLEELVAYWNLNHRIGTRREIIENSVDRRLAERDPDRESVNSVTLEKIRLGAELLAAAATLTGRQSIAVPGGPSNAEHLTVESILPDWKKQEQDALLSRPIFDEAIYGTVRFHHRSVREYLTAKWFAQLLACETSRRDIETLLFRNQYELEVVTPLLRPILPWLAIFDQKILNRIYRLEPEILLEGGDPSQLPLEIRKSTLRNVCSLISHGDHISSASNGLGAVQRFSEDDLADDIRKLLAEFQENEEVQEFLLRMIWQGSLCALSDETKRIALNPATSLYTRIYAFRALKAIGNPDDLLQVRTQFAGEEVAHDRQLLGELVDFTDPTPETVTWLLNVLERVEATERYSVDHLVDSIAGFVKRTNIDDLPILVRGLSEFTGRPPFVERRHCEVSAVFGWLLVPLSQALEQLIINGHPSALEEASLEALDRLATAQRYQIDHLSSFKERFADLVPQWSELNRTLFWHEVEQARRHFHDQDGNRLTEHWQATFSGTFTAFTQSDFDDVCNEISSQRTQDNKLVALSVAFFLYRDAGRPRPWRERLKQQVSLLPELEERLSTYLRPPRQSAESRRSKRWHSAWKRRMRNREEKEAQRRAEWKEHLTVNLEEIVTSQSAQPEQVLRPLFYLFDRAREKQSGNSRYTEYNWQALISEFGEGPAQFYRDACVSFWRHNRPALRSEGMAMNQTATFTIIGLVGLEIEATEDSGWANKLTPEEVDLACRHASFELNGFPTWFPQLFEAHSETVIDFLMNEIRYELSVSSADEPTHYILSDIRSCGDYIWDQISPRLIDVVQAEEPENLSHLEDILEIIHSSSLSDLDIINIAKQKIQVITLHTHLAYWYATWIGTDPGGAIPNLIQRTNQFNDRESQINFAVDLASKFYNRRHDRKLRVRQAFIQPVYLKELYRFISEHVRMDEDINRAGTGVYSPGPRDHAQEARSGLFEQLTKIEGKEAYLALNELAITHPVDAHRSWMERQAKQRAEIDSDITPWLPKDVREFADKIERTPRNQRELAELTASRLLDLKADLEDGDQSIAELIRTVSDEETLRVFIGRELREKSFNRYSVPQEEELADAKRPDFRVYGSGFDAPVPIEMKIAENWSGNQHFERLENQLCGDYLRDDRSRRGIFLLVHRGNQEHWHVPSQKNMVVFEALVQELQEYWTEISANFPNIDDVTVIGIDLTKRSQ